MKALSVVGLIILGLMGFTVRSAAGEEPVDRMTSLAGLVDGDRQVFFAIPRWPGVEVFDRMEVAENMRALLDLCEMGDPLVVGGNTDAGIWSLLLECEDPTGAIDSLNERFDIEPRFTRTFDGDVTSTRRMRLQDPFDSDHDPDRFDTAFILCHDSKEQIEVALVPSSVFRRRWQSRNVEEQTFLNETAHWRVAMTHADPGADVIVGVNPATLLLGREGRLPTSNVTGRLFNPESWSALWASLSVRDTGAHIEGAMKTGQWQPGLEQEGKHSHASVISGNQQFVLAWNFGSLEAVLQKMEPLLLEMEYEGHDMILRSDLAALDSRVGFVVRETLFSLAGSHLIVGAPFDTSSFESFCILLEVNDGPLAEAHLLQAVAAFDGTISEYSGAGIPYHAAAFAGWEDGLLCWKGGDDWIAFGTHQGRFRRFLGGLRDPESSFAARLTDGDTDRQGIADSPLIVQFRPTTFWQSPFADVFSTVTVGLTSEGEGIRFEGWAE